MSTRTSLDIHTKARSAFTLIELLVVIAIIAILAVVVVLTLNPAALLQQSRDSNRVSDMSTLNEAINLYDTEQSGAPSFSLGSSSVVYVSLPDPSATSTAGTNCASLGLPSLPATYTYHCAASSTYRSVNGQGWIPVNFSAISTGSPLGSLPVDPTNNSSSRLYYTYTTNGSQFEFTAPMESSRYQLGGSNDQISGDGAPLASVYARGSNLFLEPLDYGDTSLVGYWPLDEGASSTAYDDSGNGNNGGWSGTQVGSNGYYTTNAKVGPYAGDFDGSSDYVDVGNSLITGNQAAIVFWAKNQYGGPYNPDGGDVTETGFSQGSTSISPCNYYPQAYFYISGTGSNGALYAGPSCSNTIGTWMQYAETYNGATSNIYINGVNVGTFTTASGNLTDGAVEIGAGSGGYWDGLISDIRIYNRALSATQIAAMYNGGK